MAKILKNTTGSAVPISDTGQTVPASGQITIQPSDYLLYAGSDDVITLVGDSTLVVNDGSSDLSINDGTKLIQGIFPNPVGAILKDDSEDTTGTASNPLRIDTTGDTTQPISAAALPLPAGASTEAKQDTGNSSLSSIDTKLTNGNLQTKLKGNTDGTLIGNIDDQLKVVSSPVNPGEFNTFKNSTEVVLSSDTTYNTLHSVTGTGVLVGGTFVVDSDQVECVIEIDGNVIFDFTGEFLSEVVNKDARYLASGIFGVTGDGKRLYFTPNTPFRYSTSLIFKARKSGKKVKYQLYTYSEM